ncbi:hypothetical protein LMG9964_06183 [Paraburkholderia phenoliruptrix]|uniref:Uncharacterized protein n=1 Tax=Paraburkholderia phenoliruptrix TaxID=252970 RepID=A0A6J5KE22_9BURK|nr:hypothetical protein LMG9964_06183 [Paraburkholderia phenoliruptrix]
MLPDAAWQSGAWEVERRGCNVIGASAAEALACRQASGNYGEDVARGAQLLYDETDREELMQLAARRGYVRLFRHVKGGPWSTSAELDNTPDADGGRQPTCPVPLRLGKPRRHPQCCTRNLIRRAPEERARIDFSEHEHLTDGSRSQLAG